MNKNTVPGEAAVTNPPTSSPGTTTASAWGLGPFGFGAVVEAGSAEVGLSAVLGIEVGEAVVELGTELGTKGDAVDAWVLTGELVATTPDAWVMETLTT